MVSYTFITPCIFIQHQRNAMLLVKIFNTRFNSLPETYFFLHLDRKKKSVTILTYEAKNTFEKRSE